MEWMKSSKELSDMGCAYVTIDVKGETGPGRSFQLSELAVAQDGHEGWVTPVAENQPTLHGSVKYWFSADSATVPAPDKEPTPVLEQIQSAVKVFPPSNNSDSDPGRVIASGTLEQVRPFLGDVARAASDPSAFPLVDFGDVRPIGEQISTRVKDAAVSVAAALANFQDAHGNNVISGFDVPGPAYVNQDPDLKRLIIEDLKPGQLFTLSGETDVYRKGSGWKFEKDQHQAFDNEQHELWITHGTAVELIQTKVAEALVEALADAPTDEEYHTANLHSVPEGFAAGVVKLVRERGSAYGNPSENHQLTAELWGAWLTRALRLGQPIVLSAEDVCMLNVLQKQSRLAFMTKDDSWFDIAGYTENVAMLEKTQRNG